MGGYLANGGLKTWYDEHGVGEPLELLHGGLSRNATWAAQMSDFAAQFRVIAPERWGHGPTPGCRGTSVL
jgi:pimeloyl-ACP methyl ester carboxylesterase